MIEDLIDRLIAIERAEIGYSPNGGRAKYFSEIKPSTSLNAWCLIFQIYCAIKAFGEKDARQLMFAYNHWMYFVSALALRYQEHGLIDDFPRKGDFAFFGDENENFNHIGLVSSIENDGFLSIEGNVDDSVKEIFHQFSEKGIMYARPPYWQLIDQPGNWIKEKGVLSFVFEDGTIPKNGWYIIDGKKYDFDQYGAVIAEEE